MSGARRPAFHLAYETPTEWVARVEEEPLTLLSDHAHCEMKAAASAQGLIARYPDRKPLVLLLGRLAAEEMEHFDRVVRLLDERGGALLHVERNPYAERLLARSNQGRSDRLLDRLTVAGLIESRSLERFWLLAEHLRDASLASLYRDLLVSEASHAGLFFGLARDLFGRERASARQAELTAAEGEIVAALPFEVRMHSGLCPTA